MSSLKDKVIFLTGATKGFGKAFALKAAEEGAKIALVSKVVHQNASNKDTIFTMADQINAMESGAEALALQTDIRYDDQVERAIEKVMEQFGQIDICINAASVNPSNGNKPLDMTAFDLYHQINVRSIAMIAESLRPIMKHAENPHILCLAPSEACIQGLTPSDIGYTFSRSSVTHMVHYLAKYLASEEIAVNALWPKGPIDQFEQEFFGYAESDAEPMSIALMVDAAIEILKQPSRQFTGRICQDQAILAESGAYDLNEYYPDQLVQSS